MSAVRDVSELPEREMAGGGTTNPRPGPATLEVSGLRKRYGDVEALAGVDLEVAAGEVLCLLGPNGAGKTTLVSIVAGLRRPDAGRVVIEGVDAAGHPQRARASLGLAGQDPALYPTSTVRENLEFFASLMGVRGAEGRARVREIAEQLSLTELWNRQARALSGGEKRRLHTAIALVHRPRLVLLDEPTAGADVPTRGAILELVRALAADGAAVLYSTHYLHEVESMGADVAILEQGRVIARADVANLVRTYGHTYLELAFSGEPPSPDIGLDTTTIGSSLRVTVPDGGIGITEVLRRLGPDADRVLSVETLRPSLESVYLSLTGRRYGEETAKQEDGDA